MLRTGSEFPKTSFQRFIQYSVQLRSLRKLVYCQQSRRVLSFQVSILKFKSHFSPFRSRARSRLDYFHILQSVSLGLAHVFLIKRTKDMSCVQHVDAKYSSQLLTHIYSKCKLAGKVIHHCSGVPFSRKN